MKNIIAGLNSFLSGPDGQASSKRLKSFIFCILVVFVVMWHVVARVIITNIDLYVIIALLITVLLLDAVITMQDLSVLKNGSSGIIPGNPDVIKEGDAVTITKTD